MKYLRYIFFALMMSITVQSLAQTDTTNTWEQRKKQYKADKIAYISMVMNFTVEDAQKFWPLYNKYDAKYDQLFCQRRQAYDGRKLEQMTDAECATAMDKLGELDRLEMQTHREYEKELRQLFPAKFVLRYFTAESDFKRKAVNRPKFHGQIGVDYNKQ